MDKYRQSVALDYCFGVASIFHGYSDLLIMKILLVFLGLFLGLSRAYNFEEAIFDLTAELKCKVCFESVENRCQDSIRPDREEFCFVYRNLTSFLDIKRQNVFDKAPPTWEIITLNNNRE